MTLRRRLSRSRSASSFRFALDAQRNVLRGRAHFPEHRLRQGVACEHGHDPQQAVVDDQRIAGERHHSLALGPLLISHARVADDGIGQVRLALLGDQSDLELADGDPAMGTVKVRVHSAAGDQQQCLALVVDEPDAGKCRSQVPHQAVSAALEHGLEIASADQRVADLAGHRRDTASLFDQPLVLLSVGDVAHEANEHALPVLKAFGDRQLDGKLGAVGSQGEGLEPAVQHGSDAAAEIRGQRGAMLLAKPCWNDDLVKRAAQNGRAAKTECSLGRGIQGRDLPALVHANDGIEGAANDRPIERAAYRCRIVGRARRRGADGRDNLAVAGPPFRESRKRKAGKSHEICPRFGPLISQSLIYTPLQVWLAVLLFVVDRLAEPPLSSHTPDCPPRFQRLSSSASYVPPNLTFRTSRKTARRPPCRT